MDAPGVVPDFINCHACDAPIDLAGQLGFTNVECSRCGALSVVPLQFGNLLLLSAIGIGGMGTVYKAVDLQLNRYVAVKILRKKYANDPKFIETFAREARAAAAVNHPNVAQVYSFAEQDEQYYLTMELMERGTLDDRITKLGKVPEADILKIGEQISAGLRAAYQRGLLHRDIKPGNIMFNEDGIAKIVDFGLATAQHESASEKGADGGIVVWGTPYYIAPETLRGLPEDFHSDMYSLGATLFHALAGRPPFDAKTASAVVAKHTTTPAHNLKTYNPLLQDATAQVIGRMLAKEAAERYDSYDTLIQEFQRAEQILEEAKAAPAIVTESGERVPLMSIIATIAAVIAAAVVIIFLWINRSKFGLESSETPASPPVTTNNLPGTAVEIPATEEVNFSENAPWVTSWNNVTVALSRFDIQAALDESENLKQITKGRPHHRQWAFFLEGVTLVAGSRVPEAQVSFQRAMSIMVRPKLPDKITPTNLVDPLAAMMLGQIPLSEMEANTAKMPTWAAGLVHFLVGLKQFNDGKVAEARPLLDKYLKMPVDKTQAWAYGFQPTALAIVRDIDKLPTIVPTIDKLMAEGKLDAALQIVHAYSSGPRYSSLQSELKRREQTILAAQKALPKVEPPKPATPATPPAPVPVTLPKPVAPAPTPPPAAVKPAPPAKLTPAQAAAERQKADAEVKQLQAIQPSLAPLLASYDFHGAQAKYDAVAGQLTTAAAHQALERSRSWLHWLAEFKTQLGTDFKAQPFDGQQVTLRSGATAQGKLVAASDTDLTVQAQYGELALDWRDVPPASLLKIGEFYAQAFAGEKPATRARRYLALAIFAKQYGLNYAADLKQATQLDPSLQAEVDTLFGK